MNKKCLLISTGVLLFAANANAALLPTQAAETLTWKGLVPFSVASDKVVITGELGGPIRAGFLNVKTDGTFSSTAINVEAHDNLGDATTPVVGDPVSGNVKWGLAAYTVDASTADMSGANLTFVANGNALTTGSTIKDGYALAVNVANDAPISSITAGERVQVNAVITAELALL
jgi:hypothetical protein